MLHRFPSAGALPERLALATRPDAPLLLLAADEALPVRLAVAANPHAPRLADALLARDPVAEIRASLARKLALHATELAELGWARLRRLARDESPQVRHAVADTLTDLPDAPHDLVLTLARDPEPGVSEPLIRLSRVLTEPDLLELVREPQARPSVARRLNLTEPVARAILLSGDAAAMAALRRNPTARLPAEADDKAMTAHGQLAPKVGVIEASQI
ncbi:DUF2336 domain-containing protein [Sediminicoccus sp. BL-A-41-H5]|uniref:DUF2336 domain-containing protein n=1 Tax=Sediminicoccus sp. BL-A-41-H5 TaxID=3421106 RepID=UPI003D66BA6C